MNLERRIWMIGNISLLLLVLLSLRIVYWQLVRTDLQPVAINPVEALADQQKLNDGSDEITEEAIQFLLAEGEVMEINSLPLPVIQRTSSLLRQITRGNIYDRAGNVVAYDVVLEEGGRRRIYPAPAMAHITGYVTGLRTGVSGLELAYNRSLLGLNRVDTQVSRLVHQPLVGNDLILTVDAGLQQQAEAALGGQTGSVVILDGDTGGVLAMVSSPRYDPNLIFEEGYAANLLAGCSSVPGCNAPFLNRATQALYSPGSTWKTVTLIAALDSGLVTPETVFDFGERYTTADGKPYFVYVVDGFPITDPNHSEARLDLTMAYAKSANAAFARMGDEMDPQVFAAYAARFGFVAPGEDTFPVELPFVSSQLANDLTAIYENDVLRATTGMGQGELLATPLNMAMVVLSVVNDGDIPMPHLVYRIHPPYGLDVRGPMRRTAARDVMSRETARQVREMMIRSAQEGSGRGALVEGLTIGGKTGTAQLGGNLPPHAWFTGFASNGDHTVVMAIVVEHGGQGSLVAAPIFAQLAPAALHAAAHPVTEIP